MAIPAQPTSTSIVTEGLKLYGLSSPTTSQITRGIDEGLESVKKDLMLESTVWKFLQKTMYFTTRTGVNKYQLPTDYMKFVSLRMMDGSRADTAQSVTSTAVTLAAGDGASESDTIGKYLLLTSGTASGLALQIDDYNPSTKVATMEEAFSITPVGTPTYLIVDRFDPVDKSTIYARKDIPMPQIRRKPTEVMELADDAEGDLFFNYAPDKVYGCELTYFVDLGKVDLTSTLYSTFLRLAQRVLTQGIYVWSLNADDSRYPKQKNIYDGLLLKFRATYGFGQQSEGMQVHVEE